MPDDLQEMEDAVMRRVKSRAQQPGIANLTASEAMSLKNDDPERWAAMLDEMLGVDPKMVCPPTPFWRARWLRAQTVAAALILSPATCLVLAAQVSWLVLVRLCVAVHARVGRVRGVSQ